MTSLEGHGGDFVAEAMRRAGVETLFTLSGGHIFPIYDGLHTRGMRIVDTRHEQTATFAAEAYGKLTRKPGVAALTAGPGITNGMSAVVSAHFNGTPLVVLGGRAPQIRWGQGSLQEMDHVPLYDSVTKRAETVHEPERIYDATLSALRTAAQEHKGPVFLDFPLEVIFSRATIEALDVTERPMQISASLIDGFVDVVKAIDAAERPVLLLGSDVWQGEAEKQARGLLERHRIPTIMNGMGRGIVPADHDCAFSHARGHAFANADLVVVVGTALDFRLGFGSFGAAKVVHIQDDASCIAGHVPLTAALAGPLAGILEALAETLTVKDRSAWVADLRQIEDAKRAALKTLTMTDATPMHPARIYGTLLPKLQRDAIVICDGGDFVSWAGKLVDVYEPGGWLDPGAYGCLGTGPGYALAAGLLYPGRQIVVLMGDGAAGFSMGDWDTLVRFGIDVTIVIGNNGIWGLEKHPMKFLYGYDVAADLQPETRYDEVMRALGGSGEMVADAASLDTALDRAFATQGPSLVNVICDPAVAYPRSSNLA